jgi:hypothetical protein
VKNGKPTEWPEWMFRISPTHLVESITVGCPEMLELLLYRAELGHPDYAAAVEELRGFAKTPNGGRSCFALFPNPA